MKAFLILTWIVLISCSGNEKGKSSQDSIPLNDSTRTAQDNPFPDKSEKKTYTEGDLRIEEELLYTMKGQEGPFYKLIASVRAINTSSNKVLWDSTFKDEGGDSLRLPYFYTSSPACCASENGFAIREALTGKAIARYTYLETKNEKFDFKLGYYSARAFNFKYKIFDKKNGTLMGEIFTYKGEVNSLLQVRHQGDSVDFSITPEITVVSLDSLQSYVSGKDIYINRKKAYSIPYSQFFIKLQYGYYPHVKVFLPIDQEGNIDINYITTSDRNEFLFEFVRK